ncbi:MAG: RT0821/Lpp0805 family surface protein [Alphaproteobacteria bacterium]
MRKALTKTYRKSWVAGFAALAFVLAACQSYGEPDRQLIGGVLGGTIGAVTGAQFGSGSGRLATTALGAVLGAYFGSEVGRHLDQEDRRRAEGAFVAAASSPTGQSQAWSNPESGNSGSVTMMGPAAGYDEGCREFTQTVTVDGESQQSTGVACRQNDGSWQIINS